MSEEEQEAIEELKNFSNLIIEGGIPNSFIVNKLKITFNLIDKLQKELQYEKNEIMNLAGMLDEKDEEIKSLEIDLEIGNNMCGKLQKENEKLKELVGFTTIRIKTDDIKMLTKDFVSEDKIRTKIEKIKKEMKTENYIVSLYAIGILEELLGDDE